MIVNAQARPYRYRTITSGFRQRSSVGRRTQEMSVAFRRAVGITLCAAFVLVFACGQFFHWMIMKDYQEISQLQVIATDLGTANINELAKRAKLMSPQHVEAVAAVRLDLHAPTKGQIHNL